MQRQFEYAKSIAVIRVVYVRRLLIVALLVTLFLLHIEDTHIMMTLLEIEEKEIYMYYYF